MKWNSVILLAAIGSLGTQAAFGQPEIVGLSGDGENGQVITVYGTSFGSKNPAPPIKWDNFENGMSGEVLQGGDAPAWITGVDLGGSWSLPHYSDAALGRAGNITCRQSFGPSSDGYVRACQMELEDPRLREVFFSGWVYQEFPEGASLAEPGVVQVLRHSAREASYSATFRAFPAAGPDSGQIEANNCAGEGSDNIGAGPGLPLVGTWTRVDLWHGFDGDNETMNLDVCGTGQYSITGVNVGCEPSLLALLPRFFGEANAAARDFYWDDIYVDNTRARVEIGDNARLEDCTHREMQIPESWSESAIDILVVQGSFSSGESVFLFVIDGEGRASEGYAMVLQGSDGSSFHLGAPRGVTWKK